MDFDLADFGDVADEIHDNTVDEAFDLPEIGDLFNLEGEDFEYHMDEMREPFIEFDDVGFDEEIFVDPFPMESDEEIYANNPLDMGLDEEIYANNLMDMGSDEEIYADNPLGMGMDEDIFADPIDMGLDVDIYADNPLDIGLDEEIFADPIDMGLDEEIYANNLMDMGSDEEIYADNPLDMGLDEEIYADDPLGMGSDEEIYADNPLDMGLDEEIYADDPLGMGMDDEIFADDPLDIRLDEEIFVDDPLDIGLDEEIFADDPMDMGFDEEIFVDDPLDIGLGHQMVGGMGDIDWAGGGNFDARLGRLFEEHDLGNNRNTCTDPSILPAYRACLAGAQEVRWNATNGSNGPAMNNLGRIDGRVFIASQSNIIVYEKEVRVMVKAMPSRINNLVSGYGPLGASLAVTLDNGQVSLLKARPLEVIYTWHHQRVPAWGLSMHSGAVATGSNDYNVRVFLPPDSATSPPTGTVLTVRDVEDGPRQEDARGEAPYRTFRGHTGNLPCVVAWDNYVLSGGLDGSLAIWRYDRDRPLVSRHQWLMHWACARVPLHSLQVYRGTSKVGRVPEDRLFFELPLLPAPLLECDILPFLSPKDLRSLGQVRSRWVHVTDAELSSRHRTESVILGITNKDVNLMNDALEMQQHYVSPEGNNDFAFVSTSLYKNRLFLARKTQGFVLQVSLFRLFNSDAIAMRVDALQDLPPSYGICVSDGMLFGITQQGSLWRSNLVDVRCGDPTW